MMILPSRDAQRHHGGVEQQPPTLTPPIRPMPPENASRSSRSLAAGQQRQRRAQDGLGVWVEATKT
jgi:hypothetical protein